jgi:glutathione peroxidase
MSVPLTIRHPGSRFLAGSAAAAMLLFAPGARVAAAAANAGQGTPARGVYDFSVATSDSGKRSLSDYRGKVLLIVNTASRCGFTPQYKSLEALYEKYREAGFEILAFPANNFLNQEPGSDAEIQSFCSLKYHTTFPVFAKSDVKGGKISPLYAWLTKESAFPGDIPWNFTKFLVARNGTVVARFEPKVDPLDPKVTARVEAELKAH